MAFYKLFSEGGFVYNHQAKSTMIGLGYKKDIQVIYNSLDYRLQKAIIAQIGTHKSDDQLVMHKPYVILTGRIEARKNIELLLDAIKILKQDKKGINAIIVGEGIHKKNLINYAKEIGIEQNVDFRGACYDESRIAELYSGALACVIPNAVGLSAIHSLTYQVPVITSNDMRSHGPEIEAVSEGKTGFFYEAGNAEDLAKKILVIKDLSREKKDVIRDNCEWIIDNNFNPIVQHSILCRRLWEVFENKLITIG